MKRGRHPNSRANLRPPWSPGESGNPAGRGPLWTVIEDLMATPPEEWPAVTAADLGIEAREAAAMVRAARKPRVCCSVCLHPDLVAIDGLLTLGAPIRAVAEKHKLTRSAVGRHKLNHLSGAVVGHGGPVKQGSNSEDHRNVAPLVGQAAGGSRG